MNRYLVQLKIDADVLTEAAKDAQKIGKEQQAVLLDKMARSVGAKYHNMNFTLNKIKRSRYLTWRDIRSCLPREPKL